MLKNIFLKSLKDSLLTILYIFITYFLVCLLIMYAVSELPLKEIQFIFDRLKIPEPLTTFISGPGGINLTTVEGILNTDMFTIFAPLVTIGFAIFFGYNANAFFLVVFSHMLDTVTSRVNWTKRHKLENAFLNLKSNLNLHSVCARIRF